MKAKDYLMTLECKKFPKVVRDKVLHLIKDDAQLNQDQQDVIAQMFDEILVLENVKMMGITTTAVIIANYINDCQ